MSLSKFKIRRWRILSQLIVLVFFGVLIYFFYQWTPQKIKPIQLAYHQQSPANIIFSGNASVIENYYQVFVNEVDMNQTALFLKDKHGDLWATAEDIEQWHLIKPISKPMQYQDAKYYSLRAYPGLSYTVDNANLIIKIRVPTNLFKVNYIDAKASQIKKFIPPTPGMFFNYNLYDTKQAGSTADNLFTGYFQIGLFNSYGVGNITFINQNAPGTETFLRLLSTWRYDKPDKMWTLSVGDDVSASTNWSSSVNYGGIQWGTNFQTQPAFITFPQLGWSGQATVPSAVDMYVNGSNVLHEDVKPGQYAIYNIPYIDGYGNMRVVTTDIFGRQQVVSMPFYASTQLLKKGLTDYTYEFGMLRQNLGLTSFDYARFMLAATKSVGVNDKLTYQWHVEGLSDQQTIGISVFKQLWTLGILNGSVGASHINAGNHDGGLIMAGFQRLAPSYSIGLSSEVTTLYFTQQGIEPGDFSPRLINQVFGGFTVGSTSFSCSYIHQINRDMPSNNTVSATLTRNIFFDISMSVNGQTNLSGAKNKAVFVTLTRALGENTSGSINNSVQNDVHQESIGIIRSLPQGPGYGYNFNATTGSEVNSKLGSLSYQNDIGTYEGDVTQDNGSTAYALNVQGGAVYLGGQSYLTRNLNGNSFAVIETPGYENVDVYVNNQLSTRTNKRGNAIVPNLLPYQETDVKIDPNTLPLTTTINETSATVAPYYSAGVLVPFAVESISGVTLTLKQASGEFVPEGSVAVIAGQADENIVGSDGQLYLSNVHDGNKLSVKWEGHQCQLEVSGVSKEINNPITDMGIVLCHEVNNAN